MQTLLTNDIDCLGRFSLVDTAVSELDMPPPPSPSIVQMTAPFNDYLLVYLCRSWPASMAVFSTALVYWKVAQVMKTVCIVGVGLLDAEAGRCTSQKRETRARLTAALLLTLVIEIAGGIAGNLEVLI